MRIWICGFGCIADVAAVYPLPSLIIHEPQPPALVREDGTKEMRLKSYWTLTSPVGGEEAPKLLVKCKGHTKPTWEPASEFDETEAYENYLAHYDVFNPSPELQMSSSPENY
ncbi:hypothetical protein BDW66DRAFT_140103 [Aspergillus desertorum]